MSGRNRNKPAKLFSLMENPSSTLGKLYVQVNYLAQLEKKLSLFLKAPLNNHCKIANFANDTLVLHSDSAAWAAKLRYHIPGILKYMQTECRLNTLKTIRIKIRLPDHSDQIKPAREKLILSKQSAAYLFQIAESIPDNDLRLSLLKLARHGSGDV